MAIILEAFAVVREAARRKLGMRHFDVQVSPFIFFFLSLCPRVYAYTHIVYNTLVNLKMLDYWWSSA